MEQTNTLKTSSNQKNGLSLWWITSVFLAAWAVLTTMSIFIMNKVGDMLAVVGGISLIAWGLIEIIRGESYIRRFLGVVALYGAVMLIIKNG